MPPFVPLSAAEIENKFNFAPYKPESGSPASPWSDFMYSQNLCEYPTQEYIELLAALLAKRTAMIAEATQERPRMLEVAAGRGVLSHLLGRQLAEMGVDTDIQASDGNSRGGSFYSGHLPHVVEEGYKDSVDRVRPHIVLGAWLPGDFTGYLRDAGVHEYVLIGKTRGPGFHADHATWGRDDRGNPVQVPEYTRAGYIRTFLRYLQPYQYSYRSVEDAKHTSETHLFTDIGRLPLRYTS